MRVTNPITSPEFSSLVGIPYEERNCWRLAQLFYDQVLGLELCHYYEDDALREEREVTKNLIYTNVGDFEKVVGEPQFGDLLILNILGVESHIAVYVGGGQMLHTTRSTGSVVEKTKRWTTRIVGYYRLVQP